MLPREFINRPIHPRGRQRCFSRVYGRTPLAAPTVRVSLAAFPYQQFIEQYDHLTYDDIRACLAYPRATTIAIARLDRHWRHGEVYRARDTRLNRDVALKVLPEAFHCQHGHRRRRTSLFVSPDSQWVGYVENNTTRRGSEARGSERCATTSRDRRVLERRRGTVARTE